MPIKLEIPDALYRRLQKHAVPFVDTPLSVIEKWADHFEGTMTDSKRSATAEMPTAEYDTKALDPLRPPDLFHTRARGTFGSTAFSNWNELVRIAHLQAFAKAGSFEELRNSTHAQIREGSHSDSGYRSLPEVGISVQGVDANHAWTYSLQLAQYLEVPVRALIQWRHNPKAAHPGKSAILEWTP